MSLFDRCAAPSPSAPVPWGDTTARLQAEIRIRRPVPTVLALAATDILYGAAVRYRAARGEQALAGVDAVAGGTIDEATLPQLARTHVTAQARGWELTWRPWELARIPVRDVTRIEGAGTGGRSAEFLGRPVDPATPARYLTEAVSPVRERYPYVTHAFWYRLRDRDYSTPYENDSGLLYANDTPKPAFISLRRITSTPAPAR